MVIVLVEAYRQQRQLRELRLERLGKLALVLPVLLGDGLFEALNRGLEVWVEGVLECGDRWC